MTKCQENAGEKMKKIFLALILIILVSGCILQKRVQTSSESTHDPVIQEISEEDQQENIKPTPKPEIDYSYEYPVSEANIVSFEKKKTGLSFTAYYHPGDETNANKALAVLEQKGIPLYKEYLGYEPKNIPAYLAASVKEYVKIADFPGGESNVELGAGSAPQGKIYLFKPFNDAIPERVEGMIIHEGVHAAVYNFLGQDKMGSFPGFLNEGLAHYLEYVFKAGPEFDPLDQIYHADLLIKGSKTGNPQLLSMEELAQKCEGYIAEENLNFLCRGQGSYVIWYLNKAHGKETIGKFLKDLKQTSDWKKSLSNVTEKTVTQLNQEVWADLKLAVEKYSR